MAVIGALLTMIGAFLLYGGADNQRLSARGGRRPAFRIAGGAAFVLALPFLFGGLGPATAIFMWLILAMLIWSIVPLALAWWRRPKETRQ